jgi:hypothetical protein
VTEPGGRPDERPGIEWGGLPSPELLRVGVALVLGALVAVIGALILGEYQFEGLLPFGAGALFGLVVAEVVVEVGRRRTVLVAIVAGLSAGVGLVWAGWISAGSGLSPIPSGAWLAAGVGFAAAVLRTIDLRRSR